MFINCSLSLNGALPAGLRGKWEEAAHYPSLNQMLDSDWQERAPKMHYLIEALPDPRHGGHIPAGEPRPHSALRKAESARLSPEVWVLSSEPSTRSIPLSG